LSASRTGRTRADPSAGLGPAGRRTHETLRSCPSNQAALFGDRARVLDLRRCQAGRASSRPSLPGVTCPSPLDQRIVRATAGCRRVGPVQVSWPGSLRLTLVGYLGPWREVPPDLMSSSRCVVLDAGGFVACRSPDGWHPWPGGRLESGEDPRQAARRQVQQETGHQILQADLEPLGLLHYRHLGVDPEQAPTPTSCSWSTSHAASGGPRRTSTGTTSTVGNAKPARSAGTTLRSWP